ncbi:MAG: hypothetical protein NAG76_10565 [Candidatus Pristimantibacillus lignocellulolyticus]|uniref:Uncharacterized protein n=1 Tax=Candidatus Pristimantibacillus lignocellulolyticus TaxID=2994561 RepID=A0A9J6ZKX5_9BACL|nr:MAG: hypothetical protein NAG76_10565 [Candidatus Pristimantibacillus lignocellulolyticus]
MLIKIVSILVIGAILYRVDVPKLIKERNIKGVAMNISLLSVAVVLSIAKVMKLGIPTPLYFVSWLCRPLSNLIKMLY